MTLATDSIKAVLCGIFDAAEADAVSLADAVRHTPVAEQALSHVQNFDLDGFYFSLVYPLDQMIEGLLVPEVPSADARWLLRHYGFVENHFCSVIRAREGSPCSADKARFLLSSLLRFFLTGAEIQINYEQQYTYHLPRVVFTTHADTLAFYRALQSLHVGDVTPYLTYMLTYGVCKE